jgi:long-chain acyl-CoA synthetase
VSDPAAIESLSDLLDRSVAQFGERTLFLRKVGPRWAPTSYAQFARIVSDLAAGLAALGVARGDRVAVVSNNCLEWAAIAYASYGLGAALVPMYESQRDADWRFIVRDSGAKVLFASTPEIFAKVSGLSTSAPKLRHVACIAGSYAAILADGRARPAARIRTTRDDTAALLYTSGTTGEPKGVILSHGNILANVLALQKIIATTIARPQEHRALSFLPWAHAFGHTVELHVMIASGASLAIAEAVDKVVDNIREVRPTVLVAVPTVFLRIHSGIEQVMARRTALVRWLFRRGLEQARLVEQGRSLSAWGRLLSLLADLLVLSRIRARFGGRLRFAICGAAALPREAAEFVEAIGITVFEGYGLTEASPIVSANTPGARKRGSVGKPLPGVRVVIEKPAAAAEQHSGEIVVYGDNVMQGYHGREDENRRVFTEGHGLRTGDVGYLDADGYLFITARIKEQYKLTNAKYVAPSPLEDQLKLSPFIDNVMLYGDNKPYNVALIVPDAAALREFAERTGLGELERQALLSHGEVRQLFARELARLSGEFKGYERVREFAFAPEPFAQDNGTLTPSLKLKRHEILRRWGSLLEALYPEPPGSVTRAARPSLTS